MFLEEFINFFWKLFFHIPVRLNLINLTFSLNYNSYFLLTNLFLILKTFSKLVKPTVRMLFWRYIFLWNVFLYWQAIACSKQNLTYQLILFLQFDAMMHTTYSHLIHIINISLPFDASYQYSELWHLIREASLYSPRNIDKVGWLNPI